MATEGETDLRSLDALFEPPVLIVSTVVGRGMYTLGEAVRERFADPAAVEHVAVEDHLPGTAVGEDLKRYKWICNNVPWLLHLIYTIPVFYYRKYWRESRFDWTDLTPLKNKIEAVRPRTVLCISHRPAFWLSNLKRRQKMDFKLLGLLGEYGPTLGWKYIFWGQMNGFLSPLPRERLNYSFPADLTFKTIDLPARGMFSDLAAHPGSRGCVLLVCGYWGQGPILRLVKQLLTADAALRVHAVCGENGTAYDDTRRAFQHLPNVQVHGAVESLAPLMREAGCVITKPGISTTLEAWAARRKLFFVPGIPVAENRYNAGYAQAHFGAEWFTGEGFRRWLASHEG